MKQIKVYRAGLHLGEENLIEGNRNSGMINFSGCHLNCHFCYTPETSKEWKGSDYSPETFVELCHDLVRRGARNLNLISPTQFFPLLAEPLKVLRHRYGTLLPIVLKISGYESQPIIDLMVLTADVFVPDFKVWDEKLALQVGLPQRYGTFALSAISRMMETHGSPQYSENHKLSRGILVRHLLMPNATEDSFQVLNHLGNIGYSGAINLMTYFYDPRNKKVSNASPQDLTLLTHHAQSLGMQVLVNGKLNHPYQIDCGVAEASQSMLGGAYAG